MFIVEIRIFLIQIEITLSFCYNVYANVQWDSFPHPLLERKDGLNEPLKGPLHS